MLNEANQRAGQNKKVLIPEIVSFWGTDVLVQGKLNHSIRKCHGLDPVPSAVPSGWSYLDLIGCFFPSLVTKKRWKTIPYILTTGFSKFKII